MIATIALIEMVGYVILLLDRLQEALKAYLTNLGPMGYPRSMPSVTAT